MYPFSGPYFSFQTPVEVPCMIIYPKISVDLQKTARAWLFPFLGRSLTGLRHVLLLEKDW